MSSRLSRSPKIEGLCSEWDECEDELEESKVPEDGKEIEERQKSDEDKSELEWARVSPPLKQVYTRRVYLEVVGASALQLSDLGLVDCVLRTCLMSKQSQ